LGDAPVVLENLPVMVEAGFPYMKPQSDLYGVLIAQLRAPWNKKRKWNKT
jgi:hypothetical protein